MLRPPTVALVVAVSLACLAAAPKPLRRARPPRQWDKVVESQFAADAFALLDGERPGDFGRPATGGVAAAPAPAASAAEEPVADGDFDRSDMMKKLKTAEDSLAEVLSGEQAFRTGGSRAEQAADLVVMMGRTLFGSDPDFADEDDYLKFAEDMTGAAKQLKVLVKKGDYAGARGCLDRIKKSCDGCHGSYR